jgi:hypothetical protein
MWFVGQKEINEEASPMTTSGEVTGIAKFCDSVCPICVAARGRATWLRPVVKLAYYCFCGKPARLLRIATPCTEREKQTGKKPWE